MDFVQLTAEKRDTAIKSRQLRSNSLLPAEFYGSGKKNISLQMDYQTFRQAYKKAGASTVIQLSVEGEKEPLNVLVHEIQYDTVSGRMAHVDFINVRMDQEVHTHIVLEFVGVAPAVKDLNGVFTTNISEIEVKCLPQYLAHSIQVDISGLVDFHTSIHIKDLNIPEHMEVLMDQEQVVATVTAPRVEVESDTAPTAAEAGAEVVTPDGGAASKESE